MMHIRTTAARLKRAARVALMCTVQTERHNRHVATTVCYSSMGAANAKLMDSTTSTAHTSIELCDLKTLTNSYHHAAVAVSTV
jgi:hypothetical protein